MSLPDEATVVAGMTIGSAWSTPTITFSVAKAGSIWPGYPTYPADWKEYWGNEPTKPGYGFLTQEQADIFRNAMSIWQSYVGVRLLETDDITNPGQIRIAVTSIVSDFSAYSNYPSTDQNQTDTTAGDIWLSDLVASKPENQQDLLEIFIHEIGHALGLKHPGEIPIPLPLEYNNGRYTVMGGGISNGYWNVKFKESPPYFLFDGNILDLTNAPRVFDIAAVQALYGSNPNTNAGDTNYTWQAGDIQIRTIYDAGGVDTLDISNVSRKSLVDLSPGSYSSIGIYSLEEQKSFWIAQFPNRITEIEESFSRSLNTDGVSSFYTGENNLGIAYRTVVENAKGGAGNDTIVGNVANNVLSGGPGDDHIFGATGNDTVTELSGSNYLRGDEGNDSIAGGGQFDDINGNMGNDTASGGVGDDWVVGGKDNDLLTGEVGSDIVYGNIGADTCDGGDGADIVRGGQNNDVVRGGAGDDFVSGDRGDDTVTGGAGADNFHTFGDAGIDRVTDFNLAEGDRVMLDPGATYTVAQVGADTVITMGGGGQMILVGVQMSSLTGAWIFGA